MSKQLQKIRIAVGIFASVAAFVLQGFAFSGVAHATSTTQCWYTAKPPGTVVTAVSTTSACGGTSGNTFTVTTLYNGIAACTVSGAMPTGWVATAIYNSGACGSNLAYGNTYFITSALTPGMTMCSQATQIPTNWVAISTTNAGSCGVNMSSGNTYTITTPSNDLAICQPPSRIPAGYHITRISNTNYCGVFTGGGGGNTAYIHS